MRINSMMFNIIIQNQNQNHRGIHTEEAHIGLWHTSNWWSGKLLNTQKTFKNYLVNFSSIQLNSNQFNSALSKPFRSPRHYSVLEILNTHFSLSILMTGQFFVIQFFCHLKYTTSFRLSVTTMIVPLRQDYENSHSS